MSIVALLYAKCLCVAPSIGVQGAFYVLKKESKVSLVAVKDIADVAAIVLTQSKYEGKGYTTTETEALSYDDVAATMSTTLR